MNINEVHIANTVLELEQPDHPYNKFRRAGYIEALLQVECYLSSNENLPYKTREIRCGWFWTKRRIVNIESYPDLILRLAKDYLEARRYHG